MGLANTFPGPDLAIDTIPQTRSALGGTMIRLLAAVLPRKNPFFHSVQTDWRYTDSGPPEPKIIYSTSPGPDLRTDATPRTRSVLGGPEDRTPRVSGEPSRRKGSAHTSPEGRELRPAARGAPPRRVRGVSCPVAIDLAETRDLVPGSSVGKWS